MDGDENGLHVEDKIRRQSTKAEPMCTELP